VKLCPLFHVTPVIKGALSQVWFGVGVGVGVGLEHGSFIVIGNI